MYSRVLVPLDGSASASRALDEALALPHDAGANIQALYVIDAPPVCGRASHTASRTSTTLTREKARRCAPKRRSPWKDGFPELDTRGRSGSRR